MTRWRAASLIAVHVLAGLHFLHWKLAGRTLAPVEPSEAFDTVHLGVITVGFLFLAGVVVATAVFGRFFCGWGCHILALQDLCAWMLRKLRVPTSPIRSRVLVWMPAIAALYLFVWPQVERLWRGDPLPELHVVTDPEGWTSFTTTDLLRSFPGIGMTLVTFAVCGFVIVYFLGSRSFCSYACPYGAIFAVAERVAPLRIVTGTGACSDCGVCTAGCRSNVSVIEEVRRHGAVVDANCMKDLDCVSACPTGALTYGVAVPPALRRGDARRKASKPFDFTRGEDLAMGAIVVATLPVIRGLYDAISFLLALALVALLAYFAVVAARLWRRDELSLGVVKLKAGKQLTTSGRAFAAFAVVLAAVVLHSAFVQYHVYAGEYAAARIATPEGVDEARVEAALGHLTAAARYGLVSPPGLQQQLASLHLRKGNPAEARRRLNAVLAVQPDNVPGRVGLAQTWLLDGRTELAERQLSAAVALANEDPHRSREARLAQAAACRMLGDIAAGRGDRRTAIERFEQSVDLDPTGFDARMALAALLAEEGRFDASVEGFRACLELRPESAAAHNNLAALLARRGDNAEALGHYREALNAMPENALAHSNVGLLLIEMGRFDEAEAAFHAALEVEPGFPAAEAGLSEVLKARGLR